MYTQIPKKISPLWTVSSSLPPRGKSNIRPSNKSEDYISRLLRERPSQAEPLFLKGSKVYTQSEREQIKTWFVKRFSTALNELKQFSTELNELKLFGTALNELKQFGTALNELKQFGTALNELKQYSTALNELFSKLASKDIKETQHIEEEQREFEGDTEKEAPSRPVYLKDLLRQYKGRLYVPEEAFDFQTSEIEEFNRNLKKLPEMHLDEFYKLMKKNQIEMLTSRACSNIERRYTYHDFIVDLIEILADLELKKKKFLGMLEDINADIHCAARRLLSHIKLPSISMFKMSFDALMENLDKHPQDEKDILSIMYHIGKIHNTFVVCYGNEFVQKLTSFSNGE